MDDQESRVAGDQCEGKSGEDNDLFHSLPSFNKHTLHVTG
jgi:hypothetical protein